MGLVVLVYVVYVGLIVGFVFISFRLVLTRLTDLVICASGMV